MSSQEEMLIARQRRIDELHVLERRRSALLVIDMQKGFIEPGASLEVVAARDIVPRIAHLIEACRRHDIPVIFTEFVYSTAIPCLRGDPFGVEHLPAAESGATGLGHPSSNCLTGPNAGKGTESAETIPELAPRPDELVIQGHTYDKFYGTPLDLALRSQGIQYLVLTGITTDVCVNSTLIAASQRNYRVTAITDAVASPWPDMNGACFKIWRPKFARLRTTQEVTQEIEAFSSK